MVRESIPAAAAKSLQSCPTLRDPIDGSPLGSSVPGILQARILEWVAISFSNAWKWKVKEKSLSRVQLLATPWSAAYQAPPSMGFSRQKYWSELLLPSPNVEVCYKFFSKEQASFNVMGRYNVMGRQLFPYYRTWNAWFKVGKLGIRHRIGSEFYIKNLGLLRELFFWKWLFGKVFFVCLFVF